MKTRSPEAVSQLLVDWRNGDQSALAKLMPLVYEELRRIASRYMAGERRNHTLQTTALVNEAYLRLVDYRRIQWQNRAHFFAIAAQAMRRILVNYALSRGYAKRGGGVCRVSLDETPALDQKEAADVLAVHEALDRLAALDPRKSKIVELRYYGGLSVEETAEILAVSPITIKREWVKAKAWLYNELRQ
jgi:RNA polymerase sigma factor (TIGR02999 family)